MPAPDGLEDPIQIRRDTVADWESVDPVLSQGEIGLVLVAGVPDGTFKIGDGSSAWTELPLFPSGSTQAISEHAGSYTLVASDAGALVKITGGSAATLTVPEEADVPFPVGTRIDFGQYGAGTVTLDGDGAVVINAYPGLDVAGQYAGGTLVKVASDEWWAFGGLA